MKYNYILWVSCTGSYWFIDSIDHDCGCFLLSIPTSIHETIRLAVVPKRSLTRRSLLTDRQRVVINPPFLTRPMMFIETALSLWATYISSRCAGHDMYQFERFHFVGIVAMISKAILDYITMEERPSQ